MNDAETLVADDAQIRAALADPELEALGDGPARTLLDAVAAGISVYGRRYELVARDVGSHGGPLR